VELCTGLIFAETSVDVCCILIQRNEGGVNDEDISEPIEASSEVVSPRIEILDSVIENLSKECHELW
jgi:hypothetical protein